MTKKKAAATPRLRCYKLHVDVYGAVLNLCVGPRESFVSLLRTKHGVDAVEVSADGSDGYCFSVGNERFGEVTFYVWVKGFDWSIYDQSVLIHELLHFVFELHRRVGIEPVEDAEESFAYMLKHLMLQAWEKLVPLAESP